MRAAELLVPRAASDGDDGECTVITFGPGKGGGVEAPSGSWFFKLTGPDATVKAAAPELDAMIDSAHPRS